MIQIIDDWYITVEANPINYTVRRGEGKRDKKGKWLDRARGYFGSLRKAVNSIREQIIAEGFENSERTLEQALSAISKTDEHFEKIISNIKA
jgi:hypothetical protein